MPTPPTDLSAEDATPPRISEAQVAASSVRYRQLAVAGDQVLWIEQRPEQGGRYLLCVDDEAPGSPLPDAFSLRSLVYNYGGGALAQTVSRRCFVDCNAEGEQRVYQQRLDPTQSSLRPSPVTAGQRYGDLLIDDRRQRVIMVQEIMADDGDSTLSLVSYSLSAAKLRRAEDSCTTLAAGADYYSSPALSHDGQWLAYISWQRPNMPWDNNQLWRVALNHHGEPIKASRQLISGRDDAQLAVGESIFQPRWSADSRYLYFISDRSNWWSLYRYELASGQQSQVAALDQAEFATPQWELGMSYYTFLADDRIAAVCYQQGEAQLALMNLDGSDLELRPISVAGMGRLTTISHVHSQRLTLLFIAAGPQLSAAVWRYDIAADRCERLSQIPPVSGHTPLLSLPQPICFAITATAEDEGDDTARSTAAGTADNALPHTAYGFFYPASHRRLDNGAGTPLLIKGHGGPTSAATTSLDFAIQYFTSRGIAVLDINYRGSSGYGRSYRHALYGQWGIVDRDDCLAAIDYLAEQQGIDAGRVLARGTSAGGYLTLVLAAFTNCLQAGASYAGISNLDSLYAGTHKFEKYYLQNLLDPELRCAAARSPVFAADNITTPLLLVQGEQDQVVPAEQTRQIVAAMDARGISVQALYYANEQHGLRRAENIAEALAVEWAFYQRVLQL